jgi:glutaredoxin 3
MMIYRNTNYWLLVLLVLLLLFFTTMDHYQSFLIGVTSSHRRRRPVIHSRLHPPHIYATSHNSFVLLHNMKLPLLDQIASALYRLENQRVEASSIIDEKGRYGEPMEWSNNDSYANQWSQFIANNPVGYQFKQFVANIIAGNDYNTTLVQHTIQQFIQSDDIVMFSFTTCPFCRKAKDLLDEKHIIYRVMELDTLPNNQGNEIRAELGKLTKRTSVPSIFINQIYIGGCNDDNPGLVSLIQNGELDRMIQEGLLKQQQKSS